MKSIPIVASLFPNQLQYDEHPLKYPFFYTTTGKNYFVKQTLAKEVRALYSQKLKANEMLPGGFKGLLGTILDFNTFHHPYVSEFVANLNKNGIGKYDIQKTGLLESDLIPGMDDKGTSFIDTNFIDSVFKPFDEELDKPNKTYYKETIDFDPYGVNSRYNW